MAAARFCRVCGDVNHRTKTCLVENHDLQKYVRLGLLGIYVKNQPLLPPDNKHEVDDDDDDDDEVVHDLEQLQLSRPLQVDTNDASGYNPVYGVVPVEDKGSLGRFYLNVREVQYVVPLLFNVPFVAHVLQRVLDIAYVHFQHGILGLGDTGWNRFLSFMLSWQTKQLKAAKKDTSSVF